MPNTDNHSPKICLIIPTYNNDRTLREVIENALEHCSDLIVVNDGSTDRSQDILEKFQDKIDLITFEKNKGKGAALRAGFKLAIDSGFQYAISMDSDGQHLAEDLHRFFKVINENNGALILGARDLLAEGAPKKSSFGNRFSNFWFWVETGIKLPDTQTGFRAYPLDTIKRSRYYTNKFEFEIEVLVRAAWRGTKILSIPVRSLYDQEERVSHFRPFTDFSRISVLNTVLVTIALLFYHPWRLFLYIKRKGILKVVREDLIDPKEAPAKKAAAVGFGLFMGIIPIWGFQMLVAAAIAIPLRLNKLIVLTFSNISIPPMIPFIIFGSYKAGEFFVDNPASFPSWQDLTLESIYIEFKQYIIGSIILATLLGLLGFLISYILMLVFRKPSTGS